MSHHVEQARDGAGKGVEGLARFGYAAKGLVYMLVGVLAIQVAIGVGGTTTDPRGALTTLTDEPFGQVLLAIIALGLLGYAIWRFVEAGMNPEHDSGGKRAGYALSGIVHLGLAFTAASLAWPTMSGGGAGGGGGGGSAQDWTARLMSLPLGQWLVGLVGVAIIGYGLYEMYKGYKEKFMRRLKTGEMDGNERTWAARTGKAGLMARGVTFAIIGGFLIVAAVQAQPQEARGLSGALATLAAQPFGQLLLGLVALGLIAYGIYQFMLARFRRIAPMPGHAEAATRRMNVALIADTHMPRMARALPEALAMGLVEHEVGLILHLGDLTELSVVPLFEAIAPFDMVAGNNDGPEIVRRYGRRKVVTVEGIGLGLVHGDGTSGRTIDRARRAFADEAVALIGFGHSHTPHCEQIDGVWLVNPGSPTDKRRSPVYSYMILRLERGRIEPELHTYESKRASTGA